MKHLRARRGSRFGGAVRAAALAVLLLPLVLLPAGCGSGDTTSPASDRGNPVTKPIDFGTVKNGRVVAFLNVDSTADYTVTVDGVTILGPGKARNGIVLPFTGRSRLEIVARCTDSGINFTARGPYNVQTPTGDAKLIFFDVGTTTNGIFTTPIGVIVHTD